MEYPLMLLSMVTLISLITLIAVYRLTELVKDIRTEFKSLTLANVIEFYIQGQKQKVESMFLKVSDKLPLSIMIKDSFGNMAKVDGAPSWALTDSALATLQVSEDGMAATVIPGGTVGAFKVQVKVDADLGEGVKEILGELDIELLAGEAVVVEIAAGEAVPVLSV
jgi:hypothetical protein